MYESSTKETKWVCIKLACSWRPRAFEEAHCWNIKAKFYNEKFPLVYESDKIRENSHKYCDITWNNSSQCNKYCHKSMMQNGRINPLHGNPYSSCWHQLMGISIARWLAALMWDFLFFFLHTTSIIIFYSTHNAMSMAHAHILHESWKSLKILKYETIAWLAIGVVHDESILLWRKWSMTKLYDFVGMNFLWPCYFEKT